MVQIDRLCADFEACLGWPYVTPGTNDEHGIDCSGMFVRAFRLQGARIKHGSNTIWREALSDKGKIRSEADLAVGMAVFKWRETGDPQRDGLGNFCHIGLVTGVHPLRIVHASTTGMAVRADHSLGRGAGGRFLWQYWGKLKEVAYGSAPGPRPDGALRRGSRGNDVARLQRMLRDHGYDLAPDGIFGDMTLNAVLSFQADRGLRQDGLAGDQTWTALEGL